MRRTQRLSRKWRLVFRVSEQQREDELRFEALRVLLEQRGLISHADFETALAEVMQMGKEAFEASQEAYLQAEQERQRERLLEMLRRHEGTKQ